MSTIDIDKQSREIMTSDIGSSFFVEAGAGSGKTTQLVERMVSMVKQGIDIRHICAITFTKAAAREFYGRFQKRLSEVISETEDDSEREKCSEALRNIDLCFMGTIDAFSELILREHPLEAGIPADFSVCASNEMSSVYRREYAALLKGGYGEEMRKKAVLFDELFTFPAEKFLIGLSVINERRNTEFVYDKPTADDLDSIFLEVKEDFLQLYGQIYANRDVVYKQGGKNADKFLDTLDEMRQDYDKLKGRWSRMVSAVYSFFKDKRTVKIAKNPRELGIRRADLFTQNAKGDVFAISLTDFGVREMISELRYSAAMDLLVSASELISKKLLERGELTFFESKLALRDMLKNDAQNGGKLIRHIADRHRYFLLDEFQDTDPMQAEIFFYLAAEKPDPEWKKCVPRNGALFIVGDPKQSIYRFRNADVGSYTNVRKIFEGFENGGVLELTRNFRSANVLKNKFNNIFAELLPEDTEEQSKFHEIPTDGGYDVDFGSIYTYETDKESDPGNICNIIELMVNDPRFTVTEKDGSKRRLDHGDFMVITRTKTPISDIMSEMNSRNIPCYVEGTTLFDKCPSLIAAGSVLKAAAYPQDATAIFSALKNGIFPISDNELISANLKFDLFADNEQAFSANENIRKTFDILKLLRSKSAKMPFSALFGYAVNKLKLPGNTDDDELECLYFARELIRSEEAKGNITNICEGADYLTKLITSSDQERTLSFKRQSQKVHIANLHKVKGLEATVVILTESAKRALPPEIRTEYDDKGGKSYVFSCKDKSFFAIFGTKKFAEQSEREKLSAQAEYIRLLYVAATRAKFALIVSNSSFWKDIAKAADGNIFEKYPISPDKSEAQSEIISTDMLYKNTDCILDNLTSDKPSYAISLPSKLKLRSVVSEDDTIPEETEEIETDNTEERKKRRNAALIGTLIHKLMECVVSSGNSYGVNALCDEILESYGASAEYKNILTCVYNKLINGGFEQKNGMPDDILAELKTAEEKYCEVPFCYDKGGGVIENGVIDLLYKKDGKWRIVDYKTTQEISQLEEKYEGQLSAYKTAFEGMMKETVDVFIYHIESVNLF